MNTRRGFLKAMLAAAVAPSLLMPVFKDAHKWKRTTEQLWVPNPEYFDAPFEMCFITTSNGLPVFNPAEYTGTWQFVGQQIRTRFNESGERVDPYILIEVPRA